MNLQIIILDDHLKIETNDLNIILNNFSDIENISIKKEDNGIPIILVESKQQ